ncbi:MAG: tetratricopeptide repeat protein, partial [Armatimonadota bacterium]|nr:tetratricopeptide repeat protein [Armatimonadota bacterium]
SVPHEVIVVDNGSTDGTKDYLQQWVSQTDNRRVITNSDNLGFARGNNLGIAHAKGRYVVLVNNDVVVTPGWLERLLACAARDDSIGIVGAVTNAVSGPQYVDQALYDIDSLIGLDDFAQEWADKHRGQRIPVVRVVGFCMLIKKSVIDTIGGLDDRFGLGNFEDDDFCLRAAVAGFRLMIARDCFVHHYGSRTFAGERIDYRTLMSRNWEIFKEKWGLPRDLPLGAGYDASALIRQPFDPSRHYIHLPRFSEGEPVPVGSRRGGADKTKTVSQDRPLLSLCMIVRDEEGFIERCLAGAQDVVDEIVIVDTGSTDRTVEICRRFGARVYHYSWNNSYSDARNEAVKHARGEWILFLDADEVLDSESKSLIRQAVERPAADAYELLFYNYCSPDVCRPDVVHRVCRLYRNRPEYQFRGRIHENVAPSIQEAGGLIAELDAVVHHYGYQPDVKRQRNKQERYLSLLLAELEEKPDDIYVLYHLGAAYCAEGEFEKAVPHLEKLVNLVPADHTFAPQSYSRLMNAYWALGRSEDALVIADRAREAHIIHPEISFSKGNALLAQECYAEAIEAFQEAIELGTRETWLGDPGTFGHKAKFGIARALAGLGRYEDALVYVRQVIDEYPNHPSAHELAALLCSELQDLPSAEAHWRKFLELMPTRTEAHYSLAKILETQGRYREAIGHYLKVLEAGGESAELHQRIATCYEMIGELARAEEHYIRAIEIEPGTAEAYNDLGRLYATGGHFQSAMDCFAKAVEVKPDYANAYFNAADLLYRLGKYLEAAEIYENGLAKDPTRAEAFLALGNCCYKLGAFSAAVLAYKQALNINPDYEEARNNLTLAEEALKQTAA